jgi:hypothetical protein
MGQTHVQRYLSPFIVELHDDKYQKITAELGVPSIVPEEELLQFHTCHSIDR